VEERVTQAVNDLETAPGEEVAAETIFVASQWKLIWWRFRKHKLALISSGVL